MQRQTADQFEIAARELAFLRGKDPEQLTFYGDSDGRKRPLWASLAEELRSHYEREEALEKAGL